MLHSLSLTIFLDSRTPKKISINIYILWIAADKEHVKITDFNVSKFSDNYKDYNSFDKSQINHMKMWTYTGTLAFNAPEIYMGQSYE